MKNIPSILLIGAASALTLQTNAQVLVSDTFNYNSLAELQANWGTTAGLSLNTTDGFLAPAAGHDGSATIHVWAGSTFSVTPTDGSPLVLSADLWYSGANNQRNTVGLRNGASPLFEMGFYNQAPANGLAARILNFAGNQGWVDLIPYTSLGTGVENAKWIRLESTFTSTALNIRYDLGIDGTWDGTYSSIGTGYANPFIDLRFGGPSGGSSAGGGFLVDNVSLSVIPEPSGLALGLLGGFGLLVTRLRRK